MGASYGLDLSPFAKREREGQSLLTAAAFIFISAAKRREREKPQYGLRALRAHCGGIALLMSVGLERTREKI